MQIKSLFSPPRMHNAYIIKLGLKSFAYTFRSVINCFKDFLRAFIREKEGDLTQSYDKTPYTNRKFENQRTTHTNATKNFDYTTIADRLRTVSWSNK